MAGTGSLKKVGLQALLGGVGNFFTGLFKGSSQNVAAAAKAAGATDEIAAVAAGAAGMPLWKKAALGIGIPASIFGGVKGYQAMTGTEGAAQKVGNTVGETAAEVTSAAQGTDLIADAFSKGQAEFQGLLGWLTAFLRAIGQDGIANKIDRAHLRTMEASQDRFDRYAEKNNGLSEAELETIGSNGPDGADNNSGGVPGWVAPAAGGAVGLAALGGAGLWAAKKFGGGKGAADPLAGLNAAGAAAAPVADDAAKAAAKAPIGKGRLGVLLTGVTVLGGAAVMLSSGEAEAQTLSIPSSDAEPATGSKFVEGSFAEQADNVLNSAKVFEHGARTGFVHGVSGIFGAVAGLADFVNIDRIVHLGNESKGKWGEQVTEGISTFVNGDMDRKNFSVFNPFSTGPLSLLAQFNPGLNQLTGGLPEIRSDFDRSTHRVGEVVGEVASYAVPVGTAVKIGSAGANTARAAQVTLEGNRMFGLT